MSRSIGAGRYSGDTWLGDLSIGHSTDNGETWHGTAIATTGFIVDRPWLVGGPAGTLHVTYQDLQCCMPSAIWYIRSNDHGTTFTPAVPIANAGPDGAFTWQGNFAVSPDQKHLSSTAGAKDLHWGVWTSKARDIVGRRMHDAGLTWESHLVTSMPVPMS